MKNCNDDQQDTYKKALEKIEKDKLCKPQFSAVVGPMGPTGPQGITGPAGAQGNQGPQGINGADGKPGVPGQAGIAGPTGPQGIAGTQGIQGLKGDSGVDGKGVNILGSFATEADLKAAHPTGNPGDGYLVNGNLFVWDAANNTWVNVGKIQGPRGSQGPQGVQGPQGTLGPTGLTGKDGTSVTILGTYATLAELQAANPTGLIGDSYLVGEDLYVWDDINKAWKDAGKIQGPSGTNGTVGPAGAHGIDGAPGPEGIKGEQGIPGPQGLQGQKGDIGVDGKSVNVLGSYATLADLEAAHATGTAGDAYLVNGDLYVWDAVGSAWKNVGKIQGPEGPDGPQGVQGMQGPQGVKGNDGKNGTGVRILGSYPTLDELKLAHPVGSAGDSYLISGDLYVWDAVNNMWNDVGNIQGPEGQEGEEGAQGPQGPKGVDGKGVSILGSYATEADLKAAHPTGNAGDAYLVNGDMFVWDDVNQVWHDVGKIQGPAGAIGPQGPIGPAGAAGAAGTRGPTGVAGPAGAAGAQGAIGPTGPAGTSATYVPKMLLMSNNSVQDISFDTLYRFGDQSEPADFTYSATSIRATRSGNYEMTLSGVVDGNGQLLVSSDDGGVPALSLGTYTTGGPHSFSQSTIITIQSGSNLRFLSGGGRYSGFTLIIKRVG